MDREWIILKLLINDIQKKGRSNEKKTLNKAFVKMELIKKGFCKNGISKKGFRKNGISKKGFRKNGASKKELLYFILITWDKAV